MNPSVTRPVAIAYSVVVATLLLAGWLHYATLLLTILFATFALNSLCFKGRRWLAIVLFLVLMVTIVWGLAFFVHRAWNVFPEVISSSVPKVVDFANQHNIELPFTDLPSLMEVANATVRETLKYVGGFAKVATKESVFLLVGVVTAIGIFLSRQETEAPEGAPNLYSFYYSTITGRFRAFYQSFETVMGAQLLISLINTIATSVFVLVSSLPYPGLVIPFTFVCGMLPVVGNLISNTLIVGIAFGISPQMAAWSLAFLVLVHKTEYFLNSQVIGSRIRHPMWLTLIALILGECLMGIPGIVLAPVILNFLKVEGSRFAPPEG